MTAREALAQDWQERLEDFALAEMTVQQWCDFNRVSPYQYYYWRRRLNATKNQKPAHPAWMALEVAQAPPAPTVPGGVSIRLATAHIEVTQGFDPALLRAVIDALAPKRC